MIGHTLLRALGPFHPLPVTTRLDRELLWVPRSHAPRFGALGILPYRGLAAPRVGIWAQWERDLVVVTLVAPYPAQRLAQHRWCDRKGREAAPRSCVASGQTRPFSEPRFLICGQERRNASVFDEQVRG